MRVAIVCPIRMGQEYIRDFVEYHTKLGFDKIILIDNNEVSGPNPMDQLIGLEQYILYENARGNHDKNRQNTLNTLMYQKYHKEFDWLFFSDDDEYYVLKQDKSIKDFLSRDIFKNADVIVSNWKIMTDNGLVYQDSRPVFERFTEACPVTMKIQYECIPENYHIKSAVRCTRDDITFTHPHFPTANSRLNTVNGSGEQVTPRYPFAVPNYDLIELRHYIYKTAEEFCKNRIGSERYYNQSRYDGVFVDTKKTIARFWCVNQYTDEKAKYIDKYCREHSLI